MIKFIVDSTFGLEKDFAETNDVQVVDLMLTLDKVTTKEGSPDCWNEFYSRLEKSKSFPMTSQPNPDAFNDAIQKVYEKTPDAEIIILTISETLSGTINSAKIAIEPYLKQGKKIAAIDSKQACICGKMLLEELIAFAASGKSFEEVLMEIDNVGQKLDIFFIPATMEYLRKGGRVGALTGLIASILRIKPIFLFSNGVIKVVKKAMGLALAVNDMLGFMQKKIKKMFVCYIHDKNNLPALTTKLDKAGLKPDGTCAIDPVFGAHVGIGAIGIATLCE